MFLQLESHVVQAVMGLFWFDFDLLDQMLPTRRFLGRSILLRWQMPFFRNVFVSGWCFLMMRMDRDNVIPIVFERVGTVRVVQVFGRNMRSEEFVEFLPFPYFFRTKLLDKVVRLGGGSDGEYFCQ